MDCSTPAFPVLHCLPEFAQIHLHWVGEMKWSEVVQSCLTLCNPMDCSPPGSSIQGIFQARILEWVAISFSMNWWCYLTISSSATPFFFCIQSLPSIMVFSSELVLPIRWPKYWSFNFNISPSSEYWRLSSFRIDCFDLFAVQGTLMSLFQHHSFYDPATQRLDLDPVSSGLGLGTQYLGSYHRPTESESVWQGL